MACSNLANDRCRCVLYSIVSGCKRKLKSERCRRKRQSRDRLTRQSAKAGLFHSACEKVDGKSVAHFGGEGEEKLLDAFSFAGKTVLIVSCDSSQYDVKETGIYAAIFSGTTLEKSIKIASAKGRYFCACQTRARVVEFCL